MFENPSAVELEPWLVVLGESVQASLAMWRLGEVQLRELGDVQSSDHPLSVAIFSDETKAVDYATNCCQSPASAMQVDQTRFLSLMVDCFRQGIRYATLNPNGQTAQSVFVLRDVLKAAKEKLRGPV